MLKVNRTKRKSRPKRKKNERNHRIQRIMTQNSISIYKGDRSLKGTIQLDGSKSISNRLLIIQALCSDDFTIQGISTSKDSQVLQKVLADKNSLKDVGHAGTSMRFSTAFYATQGGMQEITGSERMKERPIGPLVDALNQLGADIQYKEKEGYPPLLVGPFRGMQTEKISLSASISSQFITAILLIAPSLSKDLQIELVGDLVSRPYIEMTIALMKRFGAQVEWNDHIISIKAIPYQGADITVEADWSAASYYYVLAAFANDLDLTLKGLFQESLQGDAVIHEILKAFDIQTEFLADGVRLTKSHELPPPFLEYDFIKAPDIAQSVFTLCAGSGTSGLFSGLKTLHIKETDRIKAMQTELGKLQVYISKLPPRFSKNKEVQYYMQEGRVQWPEEIIRFGTYKDHRMAMSLTCLSMFRKIEIEDPSVVEKSYPQFWEDLRGLGFEIQ